MSTNIITHLERFLGKIDEGWKDRIKASNKYSIASFLNQPVEDINTYSTIGLSNHVLSMPNDRQIRQELIFVGSKSIAKTEIVSLLFNAADSILSKHGALLRGELMNFNKPFFEGSKMESLYVSIPIIFDENFSIFNGTAPATVFTWLIPLYEKEASYIHKNGWDKFESLMEEKDPDLWDINRNLLC